MQHLTEEQLVSHYYKDDDASAHLAECSDCRSQYDTLTRVLALVTEAPVPEKGENYGTEVWNRLRWRVVPSSRRPSLAVRYGAIAAMLAVAFVAGLLWRERPNPTAPSTNILVPTQTTVAATQPADAQNRILLVVIGDHLDTSERVLMEFVNADPTNQQQLVDQQKRAGELVSANRIYRTSAAERGDDRVTAFLSDLEPVLIEIANAGPNPDAAKISQLQKRIESRGLLFQVRVISAQVTGAEKKPVPIDSDTL